MRPFAYVDTQSSTGVGKGAQHRYNSETYCAPHCNVEVHYTVVIIGADRSLTEPGACAAILQGERRPWVAN